jgi:hypothetical protein
MLMTVFWTAEAGVLSNAAPEVREGRSAYATYVAHALASCVTANLPTDC